MANNMELSNRLRDLRKSNGFTQGYVANMLGLKNKSTLGSWEIGKSEPDAVTFLKLCKLYGVGDIMQEFAGEVAARPVAQPSAPTLSRESLEVAKAYEALDDAGRAMIRRAMGLPEIAELGKSATA